MLEFIPCGCLGPKKQFRAIRRVPVYQPSMAELYDNAQSPHSTSQYPAHGSPIHCPQPPHPGQPPTADPPTEPSHTMGSLTNDSTHSVPPSSPIADALSTCPHPDLRLQDYGTAQQCFLSHPVCSTLRQSHGNLAHHLWDAQHWSSRAKSTLVTHPLSLIMEYRYESGGCTGLAHSGADEEETMK